MNNRTLLYYQDISTSLLPSDTEVNIIKDKEWFNALKPHFDDLIWEYYSDRVVFMDNRFKFNDTDNVIISKIKRSFSIILKTKNYEFERLYNTINLDYNPIWNVDGVVGEIHEHTLSELIENTKTGSDSTDRTGNDTLKKTGTEVIDRSESEERDIDEDIDTDTTTHDDHYIQTYDSIDTTPPAEYQDERSEIVVDNDVNRTMSDNLIREIDDTKTFNTQDRQEYNSTFETTYDTESDVNRSESNQNLDLVIRQGNIGVTTTQKMINEEREVALFDFYKIVVHECVNSCTYAID